MRNLPVLTFMSVLALGAGSIAYAGTTDPAAVPPEQLELTATLTVDAEPGEVVFADVLEGDQRRLGWREDEQRTSSRARTSGSRGASPVRVVRACELSLRLGDEDCAGN